MMEFQIILVEDNESWQDELQEDLITALQGIGHAESTIKLFGYFRNAYQALKENHWDLLVTDIGLGGSGESQQQRGRQLVRLAHKRQIPCLVVSGTPVVTNQTVRNLLKKDGADDYFSKPNFDDEAFIAKVQELLQKRVDNQPVFINETIPDKSSRPSFQSQPPKSLIDFAIITAIKVERKAVCQALGFTDENREKKESRVYWQGRLNLKNSEFYEIVVAQSPDMANVDAALLTSDTIHHWHPKSMLMAGIAGSASGEANSGDLILGKDIYYYERGKVTPNGKKPEPYMYPADATLWSRVTSLPEWAAEIPVEKPDGTKKDRPKIHEGVIASGEKVIADAVVRDDIASGQRKIKAIEMEGYGFSKAVWQSFDQVRHLVIRAICDSADPNKNDEWHSYAATVAAEFTKHFLSDRPLDPRNSHKS